VIARCGLLLALLGLAAPAWASLPVAPSVRVLVRLLSYDRALPARVAGDVRVAVVFDPHDPLSVEQSRQVQDALRALDGIKVGPRKLAGEAVMIESGPGAAPQLPSVAAAIVCRGADELAALVRAADARDVVVMTLDDGLMGWGPAVGVAQREARLDLLIDLVAARAQGVDLSSEIFELAHLVDHRG
jgi:hypothetical protein